MPSLCHHSDTLGAEDFGNDFSCPSQANLMLHIEQIRDCNIAVELGVSNYYEYARVSHEIRSEFARLIRNFSTMLFRRGWLLRDLTGSGGLPEVS